jgi:hypothetical protein
VAVSGVYKQKEQILSVDARSGSFRRLRAKGADIICGCEEWQFPGVYKQKEQILSVDARSGSFRRLQAKGADIICG